MGNRFIEYPREWSEISDENSLLVLMKLAFLAQEQGSDEVSVSVLSLTKDLDMCYTRLRRIIAKLEVAGYLTYMGHRYGSRRSVIKLKQYEHGK